jgi:hypothetical protein
MRTFTINSGHLTHGISNFNQLVLKLKYFLTNAYVKNIILSGKLWQISIQVKIF